MKGSQSRLAESRGFLFRRIAERPGGARAALLAPAVLDRAEGNLRRMTPDAMIEVERAVGAIKALADARAAAAIWTEAHDLLGLAGTFGLFEVGAIAGAIRAYGQDGVEPDWVFLDPLVAMLVRALSHPGELPAEIVARACDEAVAAQLEREGRGDRESSPTG